MSAARKVGQYKFDILTLTTSNSAKHHQHLICWPLVERGKKSFAFTDFIYLIFSLIIFVIKATLAKIGFTALLKSILATCIVLANKGNWGSKTWTAWHYIWERLTETNMDEQVFALYISSYTQKKLLGPRCIKIDMHVLSFGKPGFTYTLFWYDSYHHEDIFRTYFAYFSYPGIFTCLIFTQKIL